MNLRARNRTAPSLPTLSLRPVEVPEHTAICEELERTTDPLAMDPATLERFVQGALKRFGRRGLALNTHGVFLQVDPLVLLLEGRFEAVKRTIGVAVRPAHAQGSDDLITFPPSQVLQAIVPDEMALSDAVPEFLNAARRWALSGDDRRLGGTVRLHVVPTPRVASGAMTILRIDRLTEDAEDQ